MIALEDRMKRFAFIPFVVALAACDAPADIEGTAIDAGEETAIIKGLQTPTPTDAEQTNAEVQCGGPATFESATPVGDGFYDLKFNCE